MSSRAHPASEKQVKRVKDLDTRAELIALDSAWGKQALILLA